MHGMIFLELKKYSDSRLGADAWRGVLKESGLESKTYLPIKKYPDKELSKLISSVSVRTRRPVSAILEDFGEFIAPKLMEMYAPLIDPSWKTLDLIEHTEETIHKVVRLRDPDAKPPELRCNRTGPEEVILTYSSPRKLCDIAKGIAKGISRIHNEKIRIFEQNCMHKGASACVLSIKLQK